MKNLRKLRMQVFELLSSEITEKNLNLAFWKIAKFFFGNQIQKQFYNQELTFSIKIGDKDILVYDNILQEIVLTIKQNKNLTIVSKILESCLLYCILIAWDYPPKPNTIYAPNGKLFVCLGKAIFGYNPKKLDYQLETISVTPYLGKIKRKSPKLTSFDIYYGNVEKILKPKKTQSKSLENISLPINFEASCYLDSLLSILFLSDSKVFPKIFDFDTKNYDYSNFCSTNSIVTNLNIYATKILKSLKDIHSSMFTPNKNFRCVNLRNLLAKCDTELGIGQMYNPENVYNLLTEVFPLLKISYQIRNLNKKTSQFVVLDYLLDDEIQWQTIDSDLIVFQLGSLPIKDYTSNEIETFRIYDYAQKEFIQQKIQKKRVLGHTILNNRYRCIGIIENKGILSSEDFTGGAHYISYFVNNNTWYTYDDLGPSLEKLEELPRSAWKSLHRSRPVMFFYEKLDL